MILVFENKLSFIVDDDFPSLSAGALLACELAWTPTLKKRRYWYLRAYIDSAEVWLHRLVAGASGRVFVDHINGNTLDNRRENLRLCSNQQNQWNSRRRSDNTTGFKGVCDSRRVANPFAARIKVQGKTRFLGMFPTAISAAKAYDAAAIEAFGEFANVNFPRS